jgi:hypothetical protein
MKVPLVWISHASLFAALIFRCGPEAFANTGFFLLAAVALIGIREAILALAFSWFMLLVSPGIAPDASMATVGRYVVLISAALSIFSRFHPSRCEPEHRNLLLHTVLLGLFFFLHSLMFSEFVEISVLKALSWTLTVIVLIAGWAGLNISQRNDLLSSIYFGLIASMILSLPLLGSPIGYLRNGSGFQGVLAHPQAFGLTMALLGVWVICKLLVLSRPPWKLVFMASLCAVLVIMSESRTAGFSLLGGVLSTLAFTCLLSRKKLPVVFPGLFSLRSLTIVFASMVTILAFWSGIQNKADVYLAKRSNVENIVEAYEHSRGKLIDVMWNNIKNQPLTGIGFGIASNPSTMEVIRDPYFGLPVSASIEKGVMPLAVLEEVGLVGFVLIFMWGWRILRRAAYAGGVPVGLLAAIIVSNFGEAIFFSVGGMGMLAWVLLGWVLTESNRKEKYQRA